jgi:hypothetical protein
MWPSLQRHELPSSQPEPHTSLNLLSPGDIPESAPSPGLDPWNSQDGSLFTVEDAAVSESDLQLLEAWLESDDSSAWGHKTLNPGTADTVQMPSITITGQSNAQKFDDDFGPFVVPSDDTGSFGQDGPRTHSPLPSQDEVSETADRIFGARAQIPDPEAGPETISHAFIQLQALREEIAAMSDIDQRRAAAARVALAFASKFNFDPKDKD